jgi:hypothetical protein
LEHEQEQIEKKFQGNIFFQKKYNNKKDTDVPKNQYIVKFFRPLLNLNNEF